MTPDAPRRFARIGFPLLAATALVSSLLAGSAAAETCSGPPRKINVGVSVSPPNVVHTTPYVARELGIPHGTARSRLHYALQALRRQLHENDAIAC